MKKLRDIISCLRTTNYDYTLASSVSKGEFREKKPEFTLKIAYYLSLETSLSTKNSQS